jgi:drug/metabolite transporter (DMT)-like permease
VILFPLAVITFPQAEISGKAWMAVIVMGVFSTGFANMLYFKLITTVGSAKAITVAFLVPVFGTLWGVLFLQEAISIEMMLGGVLILFGTAFATGVIGKKY